MSKLKGLLLTQGMHGMVSQAEGLAKALKLDFIHEKIELNNFWKFLPPKITPVKIGIIIFGAIVILKRALYSTSVIPNAYLIGFSRIGRKSVAI